MKNATRKATECGEKQIAAKDIRKVTMVGCNAGEMRSIES